MTFYSDQKNEACTVTDASLVFYRKHRLGRQFAIDRGKMKNEE